MSKVSKVLLALAIVSLFIQAVMKVVLQDRPPYMWVPAAAAVLLLAIAVGIDRKFWAEFLSLKTTKHGMNMGTMILLVVMLLVGVNYVAFKRNKKWDLTTEKLNSLSDQTVKVLKGLDDTLEIRAFYTSDTDMGEQKAAVLKHFVGMLKAEYPKVDFQMYDPRKRPDMVKQFEVLTEGTVVFKYKGKTSSISDVDQFGGIKEEQIVNAIVKTTKSKNKVLYYSVGHGELDLSVSPDEEGKGAAFFKKSLQDANYDLFELNLIKTKSVPEGADLVMILGPQKDLLDVELNALDEYAKKGGHLMIAAEPGVHNNLNKLLQKFGIQANGQYLIDQSGQAYVRSAAVAIGMEYSPTSEITKQIATQKTVTLFNLATYLEKSQKAPQNFHYDELVKSGDGTFAISDIKEGMTAADKSARKPGAILSYLVTGKMGGEKEFSLIAFADSDVFGDRLFFQQANRDLIMNSVAASAKDDDLISIRPKMPKGTRLNLTNTQSSLLVLGMYLPLPLLFFGIAGFVAWRRRGA